MFSTQYPREGEREISCFVAAAKGFRNILRPMCSVANVGSPRGLGGPWISASPTGLPG